ncbi:toll-like receptor 4 [Argopecten irradians]|uniref:toll-like receptor 4 n=1 Tax=Argopecten irradians TaxID=31199 RepID=UPI0037192A09
MTSMDCAGMQCGVFLFVSLSTIFLTHCRAIERSTIAGEIYSEELFGLDTENTSHNCCDQCLCRCYHSSQGLVADCSYYKLQHIPRFQHDVSVIHLQGNHIQYLSDQELPYKLKYLDLSHNEIGSIADSSFKHLGHLRYLDLSQNNLQYSRSMYPSEVFQGLSKLRYLNLKQNNRKYSFPNLYFPVSISSLTNLEELLIDGVDLVGFEEGFSQLKHLKILDLSGSSGICHLRAMKSNYFNNISVIEKLDISHCNIRQIDLGTFRIMKNLNFLNISQNECLTFRVLENVTSDMPYTAIRHLDISRLHCTFGPGTVLHRRDIMDLVKTNLTHLYIDSNRLSILEIGTVKQLPTSLSFISVIDNKLSFGLYNIELVSSLPNIEVIHAEYQGFSHNQETGSSDCNDWRAPPASYDVISLGHSSELLSCNRNPMLNIHHSSKTITKFQLPYALKELHHSHNAIDFELGTIHFRDNNLTYIDLSNNLLHSWKGPLSNLPHLTYVDLSNNFCTYMSKDFIMVENIIETVRARNNLLGLTLNTDFNGETFQYLRSLKKLDLSNNHILTLHHAVLKNQHRLEFLNLSNNALVEFGLNLGHMDNLKFLDLTFNQLKTIQPEQRDQIHRLRDNLTVNLKGNTMSCVCEQLEFLKWIADNEDLFQDFHLYKCVFRNGSEVSFTDRTLIELGKSCDSYIGIIAVFSSLIIFSFSLIVTGIIYRYRWKLRYLYYMAKTRYKGYRPVVHAEEEDDYQYDAFISYSSDDFKFVRNELLRNLEGNKGLRLCLHQRDFVPGNEIAQNITNAIHQSRKTVIMLSKNYLNSYWCMFEFNMARMESIYSRGGDSILVLVFFEDIPARELPFPLLDLIETDSYIEYPTGDVHGTIVFWDKLASSISEYTTATV